MENVANKYNYISYLRVFAMLSVVLGHVATYGSSMMLEAYKFIYSYHMPLFVFISGFLFWNSYDINKSAKNLLLKKFKRLVIPAFAIAMIIVLPTELFITKITPMTLDGIGARIISILSGDVAHLWFLLMLFWVMLIFTPVTYFIKRYCTTKLKRAAIYTAILVVCIYVFLYSNFMVWGVYSSNQVVRYMYYFYLGMIFSRYKELINNYIKQNRQVLFAISLVLFLNCLVYLIQNFETYVGAWFITSHLSQYLFLSTSFIFVFYFCAVSIDNCITKTPNIINLLDVLSLKIYYVHIMVGEIAIKIMLHFAGILRLTTFNEIVLSFVWMIVVSGYIAKWWRLIELHFQKSN